jgi:sugar/nucleoside kinase (ribokinase family)
VLVIGDVMLDIIAAPERTIAAATDTPAKITLLPGGSGANQAAWLSHLGNDVLFAGRAGHDTHEQHAAALRAHGVEPILARDEHARTGVLVTLLSRDGERTFLTDRGANARLERTDLPASLLDRAQFIHVSGYALLCPGPRGAVLDFLASAVERRIPFSVDPGSAGFLRDTGPEAFLEWTSAASICFANAAEAALLAGTIDDGDALTRLGAHYPTVVVTYGASGARAATGRAARYLAANAAGIEPLDTTGAGDAFVAGFLTAHLRGHAIERCLPAGVRAGSAAVLHYGGRPALSGPAYFTAQTPSLGSDGLAPSTGPM